MNKRGAPQKYGEPIIPVAVRLPESLLQAVDAVVAGSYHKTRSEFIVEALRTAVDKA